MTISKITGLSYGFHDAGYALIVDNKIVECLWNGNGWKPVLIRTDKTDAYLKSKNLIGPNNWKVAVSTLEDALNPVTEDQISTFSLI